jgi:hypothetical protein
MALRGRVKKTIVNGTLVFDENRVLARAGGFLAGAAAEPLISVAHG